MSQFSFFNEIKDFFHLVHEFQSLTKENVMVRNVRSAKPPIFTVTYLGYEIYI